MMSSLLALPIGGVIFWLSKLGHEKSVVSALARVTLVSTGLVGIHILFSEFEPVFPELAPLAGTLKLISFYLAWPLLVSVWLVESWQPNNWSLATWGKVALGFMALFELIRRMGGLDAYWLALQWLLPLAILISIVRIYKSVLPDPLLFLIPPMLYALYDQQGVQLQLIFEAGASLFLCRRLLYEYSRKKIAAKN